MVLNTCCIRENADNKLYGALGRLKAVKAKRPGALIAVAGCLAQKDQELVRKRAGHVDVVFGTHNVHRAAELIEHARRHGPVVEILTETVREDVRRSRRRCLCGARRSTRPGSRSRSDATTAVPSASCPQFAARRSAVPSASWSTR